MFIPYANFSQGLGRPSWQLPLSLDDKLHADKLLNKAVSTRDPADIDQWVIFAERNGAPQAHPPADPGDA